jgi:hypothetical protein
MPSAETWNKLNVADFAVPPAARGTKIYVAHCAVSGYATWNGAIKRLRPTELAYLLAQYSAVLWMPLTVKFAPLGITYSLSPYTMKLPPRCFVWVG